jgi:uncharacterized protein (DUF169 family)
MAEMEDYSWMAASLSASLGLVQPPVAICFSDTVPAGVGAAAPTVAAGCRFWQEAATRSFATEASDHGLCAIGVYTHNLEPWAAQQTDLMDALKVFGELGYVTAEDLPGIPVLKARPKHVIYAPLAETPLAPEVVLVFVNPAQTLILSEATQQVERQSAPAMGRPACAVVPQVANTGRAALSLGCCGARAYLDAMLAETALFALPGAMLARYVERIEVLTRANQVLSQFHRLRRRQVEAGGIPTVATSLAAMGA